MRNTKSRKGIKRKVGTDPLGITALKKRTTKISGKNIPGKAGNSMCKGPEVEKEVCHEIQEIAHS